MNSTTPDRTAQRVIDCERRLLGGLMHAGADRDPVFLRLCPADFSTDAHQTVARCIWDMAAEREPIELAMVWNQLLKTGASQRLGSDSSQTAAWVADLYQSVSTSAWLEHDAGEVFDAARTRALAQVATETLRDCINPTGPATELIDRAASRVAELAERGTIEDRLLTSAQATNAALDAIDRRSRGETILGVPTGLADLDQLTGGLAYGQLTVLAARPSVGKTALAHQFARHAAGRDMPVLFVSLEQRAEELAERALAATAGVCGQTLRMGRRLHPPEAERVASAADVLRCLPLHYEDTRGQSPLQIITTARRLKRTSGLVLVVVDYLQLVNPEDGRANRNDQLDVVTRRIRDMAGELNVAVLALSQLSRDCEKQNRRPRLSDLRDSGSLEQHADAVILLHRPERCEGDVDPVELGLDKQRNGPTGIVRLAYRRTVLTFENAAQDFTP